MANSGPDLVARVQGLITRGVRGNLIPRGLSRALIWDNGQLPQESPPFSPDLTADLLEYGFTLLRLALQLGEDREATGTEDISTLRLRAFERAAEAVESVVRRGDSTDPERGFYSTVAACAYHLARFSARSYCLLPSNSGLNLSPAEEGLSHLLRRSLDPLRESCRSWLLAPANSDSEIAARFENPEDALDLEDTLQFSLNAAFLRALSLFDFAILAGSDRHARSAVDLLQSCEDAASEFGIVPIWWASRLAKQLVADLWTNSLHQRLPLTLPGAESEDWERLRTLFIARLQCKRAAEIELWPSQMSAAARSIDPLDDLVVSLPTSAGKTRIAELCILRTLAERRRVVYVTPLRALSAQVERDLKDAFQPLGLSVSALYGAAGEVGTDTDTLANRNIVVATPEKLDFALRQNPELLADVGLVVLDEAHMIGPAEREVRYEVLVQRLLRRADAGSRRIVCLSAILPRGDQLTDFVSWIRQGEAGEPVLSDWRPTRQRFGTVSWRTNHARLDLRVEDEQSFIENYIPESPPFGRLRKSFPSNSQELTLAVAWKTVSEGGSALIFCPKRKSVGALAKAIIKLHRQRRLSALVRESEELKRAKRIGTEWLGASHPAVECLDIGVAIHHAKLPKPFLREIETLLRARVLPVVVSSPTLAQGLNLSASSLLMYDLRRSRDVIPGEEFANIIGRAGRARVDIDGRVLYVMFELADWRFREWQDLIRSTRRRQIQSGLFTLLNLIADRLSSDLRVDKDDLYAHTMNGTGFWEAALQVELERPDPDAENSQQQNLEERLASLDSAILALVEDHSLAPQHLAEALDNVLKDSLWVRTLARQPESTTRLQRALLESRATLIWKSSDATQRRGYFAAGVGLRTGLLLDRAADRTTELLFGAEAAMETSDFEGASTRIRELAEILFDIPPFVPTERPENWREMLRLWVMGAPMSDIVPLADDAVEFIEDHIVYRLVWAVEAVRVRSVAHGDVYADLFTGRVAEALESGTMHRPAMVLLQAGLGSRIAALAALRDFPDEFTDFEGMREWLRSEAVVEATQDPNWPTADTADLWRRFVRTASAESASEWSLQKRVVPVQWHPEASVPDDGELVRLDNDVTPNRTAVCGPDFERLGELRRSVRSMPGLYFGEVAQSGASVLVSYVGPGKL